MIEEGTKLRVGAVSYLNTVPLVWGMMRGEQRARVDLSFSIPSICAERVQSGAIDVGLVPVAEIARQDLEILSDVGIAAIGPVRSILLVARVPVRQIRTLAVDLSSRTSVQLARVILAERYGVRPEFIAHEPSLNEMLAHFDAALVIGDLALRIDLSTLPYEYLDLADEWYRLTHLPMVFAAWASRKSRLTSGFEKLARASYEYGRTDLENIVESEYRVRGVTKALANEYLSKYIKFLLGPEERRGLEVFLDMAELVPSRSLSA